VRRPRLLVIGTSKDPHVDAVIRHFGGDGFFRLDVDRFPREIRLTLRPKRGAKPQVIAEEPRATHDLSEVKAVWFRRIGSLSIDPGIRNDAHRSFAFGEAEALLFGLAHVLEGATWVSPFDATRRASSKPFQLQQALSCGLLIPQTVITNSPKRARSFLEDKDAPIFKTIHSPSIKYEDRRALVFSQRVDAESLRRLDQLRFAPGIFQEYVDKSYELRITLVGEKLFPVAIDSQECPEGAVDWRAAPRDALKYHSVSLPQNFRVRLEKFISRLDLRYAAIDVIVTPKDEHVFLEVNPHGAWLWLEQLLDLPISASVANLLSRYAGR